MKMTMSNFTQRITILAAIIVSLLTWSYTRAGVVGDPFTGIPIQVNATPGAFTQWEAENYDKGGEGVAFHDPLNCAAPGAVCNCPQSGYRPDGVNVCASGAVTFVSSTPPGLWVEYSIFVNATATYTTELFVAFADTPCCAQAAYHLELDGLPVLDPATRKSTIALGPALTPGWLAFEWRGRSPYFAMTPGLHRLRVVIDHGFFNWDALRLTYAAAIEWQCSPVWKVYR
jgi:hypothetical protein